MPHTKDGREVRQGESYNLPVRIIEVQSGENHCNCTCETVEPLFPTNQPNQLVVNTKQLTSFQVSAATATMEGDPGRTLQQKAGVVGFNFMDVQDYAKHALNVVKKSGDAGLAVLETGFKMYSAFVDRDLSKVLAAFQEGGDRVEAVWNAIKEEFKLHNEENSDGGSDQPDPGTDPSGNG